MSTTYLYVLLCKDRTLYTGITTDVRRRVRQHNGELKGGAKYTRSRRPVRLVFMWPYSSNSAAQKAERKFKALPRVSKISYIKNLVIDTSWEKNFGEKD